MRVLFDTNVVLDLLLDRRPHSLTAAQLVTEVDRGRIEGLLGATTVTTVHYVAANAAGAARAREHIQKLLSVFDVAPVGRAVLSDALELRFRDYEDAVLHEAARHARAAGVVTRDRAAFARATLSIYAPDELLMMVKALPQA